MPKKIKTDWEHGEQAELAAKANISQQYLCDIVKGRKHPRLEVAKALAAACKELGLPLTFDDWIDPATSESPLLNRA